jgi:ubiquinone/menaquinone biosynthesis C-methylase UbiE
MGEAPPFCGAFKGSGRAGQSSCGGGERAAVIIGNMTGNWVIDELAYAGHDHVDSEFVAGFDRKQGWPDFAPEVAVLRAQGVNSGSTVVDLGAGTGRFALAAAPHVRRLVAVDVSPAMVSALRARIAAAGATNIEIVQAGFLSYQHAGSPADAVFTRNALHQLPDFWKVMALGRMAAVLRPGGVLRLHDLVFDFQPAEAATVLGQWLAGAAEDPSRGYTRDDFAEHVRAEFSTFRWLLEPMLTVAGFDIVTSDFRDSVYGAYTCVKR